mmetsp:Transcript_58696/g.143552  ORF Transcript_58696/g.143552 Transcript_58696/m.143552 type:complete len:90 (+) Transcript_58696:1963-2232(+)
MKQRSVAAEYPSKIVPNGVLCRTNDKNDSNVLDSHSKTFDQNLEGEYRLNAIASVAGAKLYEILSAIPTWKHSLVIQNPVFNPIDGTFR